MIIVFQVVTLKFGDICNKIACMRQRITFKYHALINQFRLDNSTLLCNKLLKRISCKPLTWIIAYRIIFCNALHRAFRPCVLIAIQLLTKSIKYRFLMLTLLNGHALFIKTRDIHTFFNVIHFRACSAICPNTPCSWFERHNYTIGWNVTIIGLLRNVGNLFIYRF